MHSTETGEPPVIPTSMTAVLRQEYGGTDRLRVDRAPVPVPGDHEVLLAVSAAGIDRGASGHANLLVDGQGLPC